MPGRAQFQIGKDRRHLFAQHRHGKGLCHIVRAACFITFQHIAFLVIGGDKNDIGVLAAPPDFFTKVQPAAIRQIDVQKRNIKLDCFQMGNCILVIIGCCDFISIRRQVISQSPVQENIVLHNQYLSHILTSSMSLYYLLV